MPWDSRMRLGLRAEAETPGGHLPSHNGSQRAGQGRAGYITWLRHEAEAVHSLLLGPWPSQAPAAQVAETRLWGRQRPKLRAAHFLCRAWRGAGAGRRGARMVRKPETPRAPRR